MIQVTNLSKSFNGFQAVKGISFSVEKGEKLILLGTSGSGKTTTLKMINGIIEKDGGKVFIDDKDTDDLDHNELRRTIGYVIQNVGLFPHYTIGQNIGIVPQVLGWEKTKIDQRVDELLDLVGLENELKNRKPDQLSGGQQQRVGIARALAANPAVILLDEPFGALDPITRKEIQHEFRTLESVLDKTMVMVTHDVREAFVLGDRICLMDHGEIQQIGSPKELLLNPANNFVKSFFGNNAYELELLVVTLKSLVPYLNRTESPSENHLVESKLSLHAVMELGGHKENGSFRHEDKFYDFNTNDILRHYFSNRGQIISSL